MQLALFIYFHLPMETVLDPNADIQTDGLPMPRRIYAVLGIWCGIFLSVMNNSIANVSLPTISADLGVEASTVVWVINAYQLATIMLILPFAALGEIFGYRKVYLVGIVVFSLSSLACALSSSFPVLVVARVCQGIGSAFVTCVNTTLVRLIYPKRKLGRGIGLNASVVATSAAAGPAVAGALLMFFDWHVLFAINVPFGVFAFALGWFFLPRDQKHNIGQKFNFKYSLLSAATFGLLIFTLESFTHGWSYLSTVVLGVLFVPVAFFFVRSQLSAKYPLLPFDLLRIPLFSVSIMTSVCSYLAQMLALISLPFFFQRVLGYSESQTGMLMTSWPVIIIFIAPVAGFLAEKVHAGAMGGVGLACLSGGLFLLFTLQGNPSTFSIVWRMLLCGFGFALFQSPNNSAIVGSAPRERSGSASGMLATARLLGQTTGASIAAFVFIVFPDNGPRMSLLVAAAIACVASVVSFSRLSFRKTQFQ